MPAYSPPMTPGGVAPAAPGMSAACGCVTALVGCLAGSKISVQVDVSPHCGCAMYENAYAFCYVNNPSAC